MFPLEDNPCALLALIEAKMMDMMGLEDGEVIHHGA
jgi:hypothetical protein